MPQTALDFDRIADAIGYIQQHYQAQPTLEQVAERVHMSPYHFQRMFTEWAGVSPKKFLQFITTAHAKKLLREDLLSMPETTFQLGLSGTGRLHDHFITLEGMTPGEYKQGGRSLTITYGFYASPFGELLIAATPKGICHMSFGHGEPAVQDLVRQFPQARLVSGQDPYHQRALAFFQPGQAGTESLNLHLKGTPFQLKVWEALLRIPAGGLSSYRAVARHIRQPGAARAVGSAIGSNPVAYLIPCHRVIQATGHFGQYHWGSERKAAMLGLEAAQNSEA